MLFRVAIACAYFLSIINLGVTLGIERFNPVEKSLFLLASLLFAIGSKTDWKVLSLLALEIILVILLGTQTEYPLFSWSVLFAALNQILVPFLLLSGGTTHKDVIFFLKLVTYIAILSSTLGLLFGAMGIYNPYPVEFSTGTNRFAGTLNPAFLSAYATAGALAAFKLGEMLSRKYFYLCALNFGILLASKGRTMTALTFVIIGLSLLTSKTITGAVKIKAIAVSAAAIIISTPFILYLYADRLEKSGGSNREVMWTWLREMSDRYPDFGIGFGHQYWATPREVYVIFSAKAAHNDFLRLLVELGVFGVYAFYAILTLAVYLFWRRNRSSGDLSIWITYFALLIDSLVDNALASPSSFTLIAVGAMASSATAKLRPRKRSPTRTKATLADGGLINQPS